MATGRGHKSYVQVGKATTWGTGVAATQKLEMISDELNIVTSEIEDPSLYDGRSHRSIIDGGIYAAGAQKFRANYEGLLYHLRAAMGGYTNALVETGVVDHTFKEGDPGMLTVEMNKGDIPTGKVFKAPTAKIRSFTFDMPANGLGTFEFDHLANDLLSDQTPTGSLSFPAVLPVRFSHVPSGQLVDGTSDLETDVQVRNIKLTYNTPLDEDNFYIGPSANMYEPDPSDFVVAEWEIQQVFKTKSAFDYARNRTDTTLDVKFQHPTTIGAASKREYQFTSWAAKLMDYKNPVQAYGKIFATAVYKAYYDPTTATSLVVRVRNTQAALT